MMTRNGKTSTILLVEDDFLTALAAKASLEKRGYRVVSAGTGEEAVDRCGSDPSVDLILMDIDLGRGIDGPTAAAAILRGREIPIIFLSSHSEPEVVERTEAITSYGYILKNSGIAVIDASIKMAFRLHAAKRNLWLEKEHLRTTLNSIGDAVIATDASGAVTRMNPVAERLTGWAIAEAAGRPIGEVFRIVNANTRIPVENPVKKVLESGAIVGLANHTVLVSSSGVEYQIADSAAPIYDGDGVATGVILVFRDVTEEYGVQEDLRRSEELYRSLFENMLNGFAYCRMHFGEDGAPTDFTYLSVNAAFEEQTGLRDVVGRRVTEVVPGIREIDPALFELYGRVSWTGEPERMEYYVESMKMWFMVSVYSPQKGYFAAVFDVITERKLAEEKIGELLREKELILKEVQHRVKNNLSTIFNFLVLQAQATEEISAKAALKDAGSRVQSILVLYDTLSRSGGYGGVSVLLYLPPLIDQIVAHFPDCGSVRVEKRIEDFVLDAKQLQPLGMIVNELLTNVMKYAFTGRRGNEIVVTASLAKSRVTLAVQDNGAGLPESVDFGRSNGFGLMLVDGLTKQLGGSIRVDRSAGTRVVLDFGI